MALDTATTVSASRAGAANRRTAHPTTTRGRASTASFNWSGQPPAIQALNEAAATAPAPAHRTWRAATARRSSGAMPANTAASNPPRARAMAPPATNQQATSPM